ncbi:unnamed protein product, partial [Adineta steineri]
MYSPLELPDDVLDYHGKNFYDLVREKCGEIIKDFMEILYIDSIKTLLGVEDDIFSLLKENCNALKHIKEQACLCLDDGKIVVKPGLRLDFDRFVEALRVKRAYGITSQFNSIDVLRRWLWIFEQSRLSNIRILVFSTDCDAKLTRSMSGTFSSNVNFTVDQFLRRAGKLCVLQDIERQHEYDESGCSLEFPKHHKRRYKKDASPNNHSQDVGDNLTHDTIQNAIFRAFDDAYKMLSALDIDKTLKKSHKSTLNEISTFVRVQIERKSHTTDYSENWDEYSDEEFDSEQVNTSDDCY